MEGCCKEQANKHIKVKRETPNVKKSLDVKGEPMWEVKGETPGVKQKT